jgi:hypothetical protein
MGNYRINIRILMWHFQVSDDWKFSFNYNKYHKGLKYGWFDVCTFTPFKNRGNKF